MATNITFIVAARNQIDQNGENQTIYGYTGNSELDLLFCLPQTEMV